MTRTVFTAKSPALDTTKAANELEARWTHCRFALCGVLCVVGMLWPATVCFAQVSISITEFPLNSYPQGIAAGPDGALWFTEVNANRIGRITTDGVVTEYPVPTPDSYLGGITAGPDGAFWFTEQSANKIGRAIPPNAVAIPMLDTWGLLILAMALMAASLRCLVGFCRQSH